MNASKYVYADDVNPERVHGYAALASAGEGGYEVLQWDLLVNVHVDGARH